MCFVLMRLINKIKYIRLDFVAREPLVVLTEFCTPAISLHQCTGSLQSLHHHQQEVVFSPTAICHLKVK